MAINLDDTDRRIVDLLLVDGRMPSAEITRRLGGGASDRSVRYRIDRLRRRGVIHIGAVVEPHSVGFAATGDVFIEVADGRLRAVAEQLAALDNVSYVAASVGDGDLSIRVHARDDQELLRFVDETVGGLDGVRHTRIVRAPWRLKDVYEWRIPEGAS